MSQERKAFYEFGRFRCDPPEHLLLCEGKPVALAPKAFEILVVLIQSKGRLLTKDQLMQQVWPDSFVEESNLTVNISALRRALGESTGGEQYIETVPKVGYRFVAPVTEIGNEPSAAEPVEDREILPQEAPASSSPKWWRRWWVRAALMLLTLIIVSALLVSFRTARLTDKDTVVLADFANSTGDRVFDVALRQGLSSQLEQSPFLNLLSDERIGQALILMSRPRDSRLTRDVAREICQRTASSAVLYGAIAQVGTHYLLTLQAVNCATGDSLGSAEAESEDKDHVLNALGKVATGIRRRLGESLASVQKYDAPAENVTTASLEALQAYSLGYQAMVTRSDYAAAVPLFQRAISLDPNFAMAYARLGTSYSDLNESVLCSQYLRRAYDLRKRVSEREQFYIAEHYEILVTGNLEAARKVDELLAQTYPRNTPFTNLGLIYSELGEYEKALAAFQDGLKLNPDGGDRYAYLLSGYVQLNRPEDARAAAREAERRHIDYPEVHLNLYWVSFLEHDAAGMQRESAALMDKPGHQDQMLNYEADTALYAGQLTRARELAQRAVEAASKAEEKEPPALYHAEAALREALLGNADHAKRYASAALALSNGRDALALSAIALAMAGDTQAVRLADDLGRRFPQDTIVQSHYLPAVHAAVWLRSNAHGKALEVLAPTAVHELGGNVQTLNFLLYPVYFRGKAYLAAGQGSAAIAEFQKIIDHPGVVRSQPIGALAHLELARALALSGDKNKARAAYQQFLNLWKDADPDIPVLKQATLEYSRLHPIAE